jgi:hypothetical protein
MGATPVCNAAMGCVQCNTAADCPASCSGNTYTAPGTCNGTNQCVAGAPTVCSGATSVCNAALGCVQCNTTGDCTGGLTCVGNTCL